MKLSRTGGALERSVFNFALQEIRMPVRTWSANVTRHSNALDLESDVFKLRDPKRIARSLKRSARSSDRRTSGAFRSAMSLLTFYINRAGKTLPLARRRTLEKAKDELSATFGRRPKKRVTRR